MTNQEHKNSNNFPIKIPAPALRALLAAGITKLEDFTSISEVELLKLHGMGPKALRIISEALDDQGLHFAEEKNSKINSQEANKRIDRRK